MAKTASSSTQALPAGEDLDIPSSCPWSGDPETDQPFELMGLLLEAHAHLVKVLGVELEEACGLPLTWYEVLVRLGRAPERRLTIGQLGEGLSLTSGGITRLIDRIEASGLVERLHCPSDRRVIWVSLSPAGARKLGEATKAHRQGLERHLVGPLTDRDRRALAAALRKLRERRS
jgi:DNA-binding MarR family transcriptional regulator